MRDSPGEGRCWTSSVAGEPPTLFDQGRELTHDHQAIVPSEQGDTLVPLALLSGVWTASLVSSSATASDHDTASALPDGTKVPTEAIEAPASVPHPA